MLANKQKLVRISAAFFLGCCVALQSPNALACKCAGPINSAASSISSAVNSAASSIIQAITNSQQQLEQVVTSSTKNLAEVNKKIADARAIQDNDLALRNKRAETVASRYRIGSKACIGATGGLALMATKGASEQIFRQINKANNAWSQSAPGTRAFRGETAAASRLTDSIRTLKEAEVPNPPNEAGAIYNYSTLRRDTVQGTAYNRQQIANDFVVNVTDPMPPKPLPPETRKNSIFHALRHHREALKSLASYPLKRSIANRAAAIAIKPFMDQMLANRGTSLFGVRISGSDLDETLYQTAGDEDKVGGIELFETLADIYTQASFADQSMSPEAVSRERLRLAGFQFYMQVEGYKLLEHQTNILGAMLAHQADGIGRENGARGTPSGFSGGTATTTN